MQIFCLTYKNPAKVARMEQRFSEIGAQTRFVESFDPDLPPSTPAQPIKDMGQQLGRWVPKAWSCMHGHMACIKAFLDTTADIAIICEDDIHLRRDFMIQLPGVETCFKALDLDILLLGYLTNDRPLAIDQAYPFKATSFTFHEYPDHVWGTQMYMIGRRYANHILAEFGPESVYPEISLLLTGCLPYSADHIITKVSGNRALLHPPMAVQEDPDQAVDIHSNFAHKCFELYYDPQIHV